MSDDAAVVEELHAPSCSGAAVCPRSRFVPVLDTFFHYREAGDPNGRPIVLLHGQPTWSFLYRNIIPRLPQGARIIAPDSVGYGFSGRPNIAYSWLDHVEYMEAFLESLGLDDMILVVHDFGSFEGLAYAQRHPDKVSGLVVMESITQPFPSFDELRRQFPPGSPQLDFVDFLEAVRSDPALAEQLIVDDNVFLRRFLPEQVVRTLTPLEKRAYELPFATRSSRVKLMTIPLGIPVAGEPAENHALVSQYAQYLATSSVPKLILYSEPGFIFPPPLAAGLASSLPNARAEAVGTGRHFLQEDSAAEIATAISQFFHQVTQ